MCRYDKNSLFRRGFPLIQTKVIRPLWHKRNSSAFDSSSSIRASDFTVYMT